MQRKGGGCRHPVVVCQLEGGLRQLERGLVIAELWVLMYDQRNQPGGGGISRGGGGGIFNHRGKTVTVCAFQKYYPEI